VTNRTTPHRPPLDHKGGAEYLGITERHIRHLAYTRQLPFVKVGGLVRYLPSDLDQYIARHRIDAA